METDEELVGRFQKGDVAAFEALVERHQREVYGLAYRFAGNHEDAHDISQEALIRVYRGIGGFRGEASFKTWLYRIVMNLGLNHASKARRTTQQSVELDETLHPAENPDPVEAMAARATQARVDAAVRKLPPKQRQTVMLKIYQELRFQDIARVMGCSVGTAKANYFHAVNNLKRELKLEEEARARL